MAYLTYWTARSALNTWKKELAGKDKYMLSKRILMNIYSYRADIRQLRTPIQFAEIGYGSDRASQQEDSILNNRWQAVSDQFSKLELDFLEAIVVYGNHMNEYLKKLQSYHWNLWITYLGYTVNKDKGTREGLYSKLFYNIQDVSGSEDLELKDLVQAIEHLLENYLSRN
ncbi:hypothetical protein [Leptospira stimsonii]|uniref:hypothetical protein n=1 Tax=Leptospira stimsonii TaxID=2202203 RepID=UPI0011C3C9B4|nr:hypothetical protein [Leptospira stimsonii]